MKVLSLLSVLLLALIATVALAAKDRNHDIFRSLRADDFIRNVTGGMIQGMQSDISSSVGVWKNIPFAGAPRFQPPTPVTPWSGIKNTTEYGPGCTNKCMFPHPEITCTATTSEDCLNLNVFSPDPSGKQGGLPVFFWIPGGRFAFGGGSCPLYSSDYLSEKENIVVVTINYRLGAFGGLRTTNGIQGSFNMQDQRMAMQWVQKNIHLFGGDATKVTIGGQSAGAMSVGAHLASPASKGLFRAGLMSSNPYGIPFQDVKTAEQLGTNFLKHAGCDGLSSAAAELQCLNAKDVNFLLNISNTDKIFPWPSEIAVDVIPWTPTVDPSNDNLPMEPFQAGSEGKLANPLPVYINTMAQDALMFVAALSKKPMSELEADAVLVAFFGLKNTIKIKELYPKPHKGEDARVWLSLPFTDYIFFCPNRNWAMNASAVQGITVHNMYFNYKPSWNLWLWKDSEDGICAAPDAQGNGGNTGAICHAENLPFTFALNHNPTVMGKPSTPAWTAHDNATQELMSSAAGNFVRTAQTPGITGWTPITHNNDVAYEVRTPFSQLQKGLRSQYCDFFDTIGYTRRGS